MNEQDRNYRREGEPTNGTLDRVSTVAKIHRGPLVYVGWNAKGSPVVTDEQDNLSQNAKRSILESQKSRLPLNEISFNRIIPVNFKYVGQAVDFEDRGGIVAEDLLTYGVEDIEGKSDNVSFGELSVLNAIVDAREPWQEMTNQLSGLPISTANKIYTLFVRDNEDRDKATAMLFPPSFGEQSNEISFRIFVQQTLTNLLNIEKAQTQERFKKGYLKTLEGYVKSGSSHSSVAKFINLFMDVDENKVSKFTDGLLKAAAKFQLVENKDESQDIQNPFGSDIDSLDLNTLFDLAQGMRDAAYQVLH